MLPVTFEPAVDVEPPSPESVPEIRPEPVKDPLPVASENRELTQAQALRIRVTEYFEAWEEADVPKILSFYVNSSETVVEWNGARSKGAPYAYRGSFRGFDEVVILTSQFRSSVKEMHAVISNYTVTFDGNKAFVTATIHTIVEGSYVGKFFMEIDIQTEWENTEDGWKIARDEWNFVVEAGARSIISFGAWP